MELEIEKPKTAKLSDYLYILYKWKKFLILNVLLLVIVAAVVAFTLPLEYKATAVVMIPPDNSMGLGGLTSLISGKGGSSSLGAKLLGVGSSSSEDVLLGILNSRTAMENVIKKFDLAKYYETKSNLDLTIKALRGDVSFGPNENEMIEISVVNKDAQKSADIANYFVELLDTLNLKFSVEQAKNNRIFIEKRYQKNLSDLKAAEDSMYNFQKKYGVFAVPEQLEVAVKAAGELESQMAEKEMAAYFTKQQFGENSPQYQGLNAQVNMLKSKVNELKNANKLSSVSNVLFPFKTAPEMTMQYMRNFREVEIQSKILEVVLPFYEQAKFDEQKSIPPVQVLDSAVPSQVKFAPKRSFIILTITFLGLFFLIPFIYIGESLVRKIDFNNPLEEKSARFFRRIIRFYKL
ncbi:MAG TPA: Wzz/FepE/Etk N-terminal domain-containing protein [Ignavibacteriales bacterium]|nr:Wzz/FepE/Etk N-terminal domain-containing protein [Ignavibacteriales bacterium]